MSFKVMHAPCAPPTSTWGQLNLTTEFQDCKYPRIYSQCACSPTVYIVTSTHHPQPAVFVLESHKLVEDNLHVFIISGPGNPVQWSSDSKLPRGANPTVDWSYWSAILKGSRLKTSVMSIGRFWYLFEDGFNPQTTSIQEWHLLTSSVEEKGFSIGWHQCKWKTVYYATSWFSVHGLLIQGSIAQALLGMSLSNPRLLDLFPNLRFVVATFLKLFSVH